MAGGLPLPARPQRAPASAVCADVGSHDGCLGGGGGGGDGGGGGGGGGR